MQKNGEVAQENTSPHDQQCFYMPYCLRKASDCEEFHVDKCVDLMPAKGNLPAGPRHHELPVGGNKSNEFKIWKRIHHSPKHCDSLKKSMKKRQEWKDGSSGRQGYEMRLFVL